MGGCHNIAHSQRDPIKDVESKNKNTLIVKTYTWERDSHGLFDYESNQVLKSILMIEKTTMLFRDRNEVKEFQIIKDPSADNENKSVKRLLFIQSNDYNFSLSKNMPSENPEDIEQKETIENSLWYVIKSFKDNKDNKNYPLSEGDYLKLGRVRFRVKELKDNKEKDKNTKYIGKSTKESQIGSFQALDLEAIQNAHQQKDKEVSSSGSFAPLCRICLSEARDNKNPFVTPCNCAGTMKYIHISCLQQWNLSKMHVKETPFSTTYIWKGFECELCKKGYPNSINVDGTNFDIVEFPRPDTPYLILEMLSRDNNVCRGIHIINANSQTAIKLGRGHDSDIRVTDISVSRFHATIKYEKGKFLIEDNKSKFGTLVWLRKPLQINLNSNKIAIQSGRTVMYFTVQKLAKKSNGISFNLCKKVSLNSQETHDCEIKNKFSSLMSLSPNRGRNDNNSDKDNLDESVNHFHGV